MAEEGYRLAHAKDHIRRVALLHNLTVDPGGDLEALRVLDELAAHKSRAVGSPAIEALTERPLSTAMFELPVAVGDVIADGVAQHVVQRF